MLKPLFFSFFGKNKSKGEKIGFLAPNFPYPKRNFFVSAGGEKKLKSVKKIIRGVPDKNPFLAREHKTTPTPSKIL